MIGGELPGSEEGVAHGAAEGEGFYLALGGEKFLESAGDDGGAGVFAEGFAELGLVSGEAEEEAGREAVSHRKEFRNCAGFINALDLQKKQKKKSVYASSQLAGQITGMGDGSNVSCSVCP